MNTKRLNQRKNRFPKQRISQLGNSLAPIIIALGISAIATVGFLKQGTKLSDKNKALSAQYEMIEVLEQWNSLKSWKTTNQITSMEFPISDYRINIYGASTSYIKNYYQLGRKALVYEGITGDMMTCQKIANLFLNHKGVSRSHILMGTQKFPICQQGQNETFVILLPLE
mgnify:CR=1 FL=1